MEKPLMSASELADLLGFPLNKVYDLMNRADCPVVQFGRRKFINTKKFQEWLDELTEQRKNEKWSQLLKQSTPKMG